MLDDAARRRVAAERRVHSVYEHELVRYRAQVQAIKVRRARARARRHWWTWLKLSLSGWRERRRVPRPPVPESGTNRGRRPGPGNRIPCRSRRSLPQNVPLSFIHVKLRGGEWTVELRIPAELQRAGVPAEQFMEAFDLALETGAAKRVRTLPGIQPGTPWFTVKEIPRQVPH